MARIKSSVLIFLYFVIYTNYGLSQDLDVLVPHGLQYIASRDSALIVWTNPEPREKTEFRITINSSTHYRIAQFITRDTFLIIPPELEPGERELRIEIILPMASHYHTGIVLDRKKFVPGFRIVDTETCNARITELIQSDMYPSAYFIYHRYKKIFQLKEYAEIFKQIDQQYYSAGALTISIKEGKPLIIRSERTGGKLR